jgi:hypothetical protein
MPTKARTIMTEPIKENRILRVLLSLMLKAGYKRY